jgi:C4-dicarboxylate-specific signal transduction histidine kinase
VATTVLADRIGNSRIPGVGRAVSLLVAHEDDLARFLTEDRRGPMLMSYLVSLSTYLDEERREMSENVSLILRNINHIRDIVSAQQAFAGVGGVMETLGPAKLVEEAVRVCDASRPWKDQRAEVECNDALLVTVDKHRVLQILVNLVTNARESMDENPASDGVVLVTVSTRDDTTFTVSVRDSGAGIDAQHLSNIFTHGFTTKKQGHGFGLHSSANAARELDGSLSVESAGVGQGATFRLTLPRRPLGRGQRRRGEPESSDERLVQ